jgi:hypothetical protein
VLERASEALWAAAERLIRQAAGTMEGRLELGTLAELGLALVGFAAIIAVFRGGSIDSWHPRARLAFWYIVGYGLGAVLFALLPSFVHVVAPGAWRGLLLLLAGFHLMGCGVSLRRHFALLAVGNRTPNTWYYASMTIITIANAIVLPAGAFGLIGAPPRACYEFGVASSLLIAGLAFVAVLRLGDSPAA